MIVIDLGVPGFQSIIPFDQHGAASKITVPRIGSSDRG